MKRQLRGTVAFAVCGSFCTLGAAVAQAEQLVRQGWELLPVMSYAVGIAPWASRAAWAAPQLAARALSPKKPRIWVRGVSRLFPLSGFAVSNKLEITDSAVLGCSSATYTTDTEQHRFVSRFCPLPIFWAEPAASRPISPPSSGWLCRHS